MNRRGAQALDVTAFRVPNALGGQMSFDGL